MCGVKEIRTKYEQLRGVMDERVTRLWAASEAQALGRGGIAAVVEATGISKSRVRAGIADLEEQRHEPSTSPARAQRVRRPGAGRPPLLEKDPTLPDALDRDCLVAPSARHIVVERRFSMVGNASLGIFVSGHASPAPSWMKTAC